MGQAATGLGKKSTLASGAPGIRIPTNANNSQGQVLSPMLAKGKYLLLFERSFWLFKYNYLFIK